MEYSLDTTYTPSITAQQVVTIYNQRLNAMGQDFTRMHEISRIVDCEEVVPLPALRTQEKTMIPNLILQGTDQLSNRVASVMPNVFFPPTRPSIDRQVDLASNRGRIVRHWWYKNAMKRRLSRRCRHYLVYATAPVVIRPNSMTGLPKWEVKSPLQVLPSMEDDDSFTPENAILCSERTYGWLMKHYPYQALMIFKNQHFRKQDGSWDMDMKFQILEWISATDHCLVLKGHDPESSGLYAHSQEVPDAIFLEAEPNLAGCCWVVIPGRVVTNKPQGQFDSIKGMYQAHAALFAMQMIATKRSVVPREWIIANPGETPRLITVPDPGTGKPGKLSGGRLEQQKIDPSFRALEVMDRLSEAQRITGSLPAEFGGMSPTNVRTARRGGQVIGQTIDFTIMSAQDAFAESLYYENLVAMEIDKGYFPDKKSISIATRHYSGKIDYTPSDLWSTTEHVVDYPIPGTDSANFTLEAGQRLGMEVISPQTFMEKDPLIEDPEAEMTRIKIGKLDRAAFAAIEQQAATPDGPYSPLAFAEIKKLMLDGQEWEDAVIAYHKKLQEQQAQEAAAQAPEAQPGLGLPGEGQEVPGAIPGISGMQELNQLVSQLGTQQQARQFRPVGG